MDKFIYRLVFWSILITALTGGQAAHGQNQPISGLEHSVAQLRDHIGKWDVTTTNFYPDGTIRRTLKGTYEYNWVIPDRVVSGKSTVPELDQVSAILFYINEQKEVVEMISVAADGNLWIMTGPIGREVRTSQEYEMGPGIRGKLRFTRFKSTENRFESKMEYTSDEGKSWIQGNHQVFVRAN